MLESNAQTKTSVSVVIETFQKSAEAISHDVTNYHIATRTIRTTPRLESVIDQPTQTNTVEHAANSQWWSSAARRGGLSLTQLFSTRSLHYDYQTSRRSFSEKHRTNYFRPSFLSPLPPPSIMRSSASSSPARTAHLVTSHAVFILAGLLLITLSSYTQAASLPCAPLSDPYPTSRLITTSDTSTAYAYVYLGSVRLVGTTAGQASAANSFAPSDSICSTQTTPAGLNNAGQQVTANPAFAKSIVTQSETLIIGNPNRDTTFYQTGGAGTGPAGYKSASYSHVNVVSLSGTSILSNSTIEDFSTPLLGSVLSMTTDGKAMAAVYDPSTIAIYSPVANRKFSYYNTIGGTTGDFDSMFSIPSSPSFLISGISIRGQTVAVSGFSVTGATCWPSVQIWTQAGLANAGGAWSLTSSFPLRRIASSQDFANAHTCPSSTLPSGALPLKLSDDALTLVVGAPAMGTVWYDTITAFANITAHYAFVDNSDSSVRGFGAAVDFSSSTGSVVNVFSEQDNSVYTFSRAEWVASTSLPGASYVSIQPATFSTTVVPNRKFQSSTALLTASFVGFASSSSNLFVLTQPNSASKTGLTGANPVFATITTPAGKYYDAGTDSVLDCPVGTYKNVASDAPCSLCPAGSYASATGTKTCTICNTTNAPDGTPYYCPTGATGLLTADIYSAVAPDYLLTFEADGAAEVFEELLVNNIFTRYSSPMIIFYVLMFGTLAVVFVYWCPLVPEHIREKALAGLLYYQYITLPNEKEAKRAKLEKEVRRHLDTFPSGHGEEQKVALSRQTTKTIGRSASTRALEAKAIAAAMESQPASPAHGHGVGHGHNGSHGGHPMPSGLTQAEEDELEDRLELEHHADHIVCAGFFKLVLFLFCASAILFSIIFLSSYDWQKVHHHTDTPINRYTAETTNAINGATDATARGLEVLALTGATISIDFFGFSGAPCSVATLQSLSMSGCVLLYSSKTCNDSSFITVSSTVPADITTTPPPQNVCTFQLNIPNDSSFTSPMSLSFVLPSTVHVTAARYSYIQAAQFAPAPLDGEDDTQNYAIGETLYRETVTHPYAVDKAGASQVMVIEDNFLQSPIVRHWNLGTLINRHQDTLDTPIHYFQYMYNTMADTSLNPFFPVYTAAQSDRDTSATTLEFRIDISIDTYYRLQTTERLIQPGVAFLTIVLGLIGIYHMVIFGQEMCELAWFLIKKMKAHAERASSKVAALALEGMQALGDKSARGGRNNNESDKDKEPEARKNSLISVHVKTDEENIAGALITTHRTDGSNTTAFAAVGEVDTPNRVVPATFESASSQDAYLQNNKHPLGVTDMDSPPASAGTVNKMPNEIELQPPAAPGQTPQPDTSDEVQPIAWKQDSINRLSEGAPVPQRLSSLSPRTSSAGTSAALPPITTSNTTATSSPQQQPQKAPASIKKPAKK